MTVIFRLPTEMYTASGCVRTISTDGTVPEVLEDLYREFPEVKPRLVDAEGQLFGFLDVFVDEYYINVEMLPNAMVRHGQTVAIVVGRPPP